MYEKANQAGGSVRTVADYADRACVPQPQRETQIIVQMARLHQNVSRLAEMVERTEQKFCTVLHPVPPQPETNCKEQVRGAECAMAEELNSLNAMLESRTNYLLSIIDRAEL